MIRSKGLKRWAREGTSCSTTSPSTNEMLRSERVFKSSTFDGEVDEMVAGRRRTDILVVDGACLTKAFRMAVPSSPAPRTRMFDAILNLRR